MSETIVALATPAGRSGIGVIRLSGDISLTIIQSLLAEPEFSPEPRTVHVKCLRDLVTGEIIDEAVITYFRGPNSFTGEDVVEISCHGSPILLRQIIDICLGLGARMAGAGEFTLRALANGRMDLAEAEAVRDLIEARSAAGARQAVRQLRGEFSLQLQPIKDRLLDVIVVLESALEFVEDDLPESSAEEILNWLYGIRETLTRMASTYAAGKLLREGLRVAIVGRPNVGKSSLFNALLGHERAIVTEIAGTTRDQLSESFTVADIPITLIDTAGLRETTDVVEKIGVERSRSVMADAGLVVVLLDASENITDEDRRILASVADLDHIIALNKIDKVSADKVEMIAAAIRGSVQDPGSRRVKISAKTSAGLDELRQALVDPFLSGDLSSSGFLLTDARHYDLLKRAVVEVESSIEALDRKMSEEIVLVGLHNAIRFLGEITGETTTEDMLTRIFSTFCIGK
jgi:tRNA modification GTPase